MIYAHFLRVSTVTLCLDAKETLSHTTQTGPGWLSRYSDSLRAGGTGDRIPVEAIFSAPVQTGSGAHPTSYTVGTGSLSWG